MNYLLLCTALVLSTTNINAQINDIKDIPKVTTLEYFPGGKDSLIRFIKKNFKAPGLPDSINVDGCLSVSFKISVNGDGKDFTIIKKIGHGYEEELIRVLKLMPKWNPKKEDDKIVESGFLVIPVCVTPGY